MELVSLAILLGITGSFHCVGMCGPITIALPLNNSNALTKSLGILSYNFGRIITYSIIGALFGFFGKGLKLAGLLQIVSIGLGVLILLYIIVPRVLKKFHLSSKYYLRFNSWVKQKIGQRFRKKSNVSLLVIGLLNGFLPCGLVFFAITSALAQGGVIEGTLFMAFFGLGTLPIMFVLPYFSDAISLTVRQKMTKAVPYIMAVFGILFILRGMNLGIPYLSPQFNEARTEVKKCCH